MAVTDLALINLRKGTAAQWTAANPLLAAAEFGFETDTKLLKIGDGVTLWASLPYLPNLLAAQVLTNKDLTSPTNTFPISQPSGKNAAIGGDFSLWSLGTSFTMSPIFRWLADKWWGGCAAGTFSRSNFTVGNTIPGYESPYYASWNITANSQNYEIWHQFADVRKYAGQTATFSIWLKQPSGTTTFQVRLIQNFGTGGAPSAQVVTNLGIPALTSSWQRFTFTVAVPSITGKTLGTNNDSYTALDIQATSVAVGQLDMWGLQIEPGSVATAFAPALPTPVAELAAESPIQASNLVSQNFLPNTNWQLGLSGTALGRANQTAMNYQGAGTQAQTTYTSFTAASNTPTFLTTNTQQMFVGQLVVLSTAGFPNSAFRISALVANTSFTVTLPLGLLSPASAAGAATPIAQGDAVGGSWTDLAAGGWTKTLSVINWIDDFATNKCLGAIRVMGLRKGVAGLETGASWSARTNDIPKYAGRTVTFGVLVWQKVQGGAGTWYLQVGDGVTTVTSGNGKGNIYSDPNYQGYEFLTVTMTVSANATALTISLLLAGALNDVYYLALPTLVMGPTLTRASAGPNPQEVLYPRDHWNPPLLTPLAMTFPAAAYAGAPGLYGFSGATVDLEAMSFGAVHKSVRAVKTKIELKTPTVGMSLFTGSSLDSGEGLIFGPQQYTQVANVNVACQGWWPLGPIGNASIFLDTSAGVITNATFDFDAVQL